MRHFPGRFLHEIDELDYARFLRAMDARQVEHIEQLKTRQIEGKATPTPDEWRQIQEHERLWTDLKAGELADPAISSPTAGR